jgi:hypothetical protein
MPNRWITFVKKWSSENNVSYGCALSKPEMKAEYNKLYPKVVKVKTKGVAKLEESRPPTDVKSKVTYPNLSIRIPSPRDNIQFEIEEMDDEPQPRSKKGRPAKYMTEDEKYKAKLESNKQKRREKAAAKKLQGRGTGALSRISPENEENEIIQKQLQKRKMIGKAADLSILTDSGKLGALEWKQLYNELTPAQKEEYRKIRDSKKVRGGMIPAPEITSSDTQIRNDLSHYGVNLKLLNSMIGKDVSESDKYYDMKALGEFAYEKLSMLKKPIPIEKNALGLAKGYGKSNGIFYDEVMKLPATYKYENIPIK